MSATSIAILFFAIIQALFALYSIFSSRASPRAYDVVFLGEPGSGKTTIITSIFYKIQESLLRGNIKPTGSTTIDKISKDMLLINSGNSPSPTKAEDIFTYRFEYEAQRSLFFPSGTYKVQFGDYPGEYSEELALSNPTNLISTKFFDWVISADMIVYVIEAHKLIDNRIYALEIESFIRSTWEHIVDRTDHVGRRNGIPIRIIATKLDLALFPSLPSNSKRFDSGELFVGFPQNYEHTISVIADSLHDIISYLSSQTDDLLILPTSHYLKSSRPVPNKVEEIIPKLLPTRRGSRLDEVVDYITFRR